MFDHLGIHVKDIEKSARFYGAVLEPLGFVLASKNASGAGFGPKGAPALWLMKSEKKGLAHFALVAKDRAAVDAFHAAGLANGGTDNGAPGVRADYSPTYYAAFLVDPDGNNVEAVCLK